MSSVYFSPSNLYFKQQVAMLNILYLKNLLTNSNQNWHKGILKQLHHQLKGKKSLDFTNGNAKRF